MRTPRFYRAIRGYAEGGETPALPADTSVDASAEPFAFTTHARGYAQPPRVGGNPIGPWNPYGGSQGQVGGMTADQLSRQMINRGPGGIDITRSAPGDLEGAPNSARMRGDQLVSNYWMPAFWPPDVQAPPEAKSEPWGDPAPIERQEFTYPTETLPKAEPPPRPSFLEGTSAEGVWGLPKLPALLPPLETVDSEEEGDWRGGALHRAKQGYADGGVLPFMQASGPPAMPDPGRLAQLMQFAQRQRGLGRGYADGGNIAGQSFGQPAGGGTGGGMTPDQFNQMFPMAESMRGNPELLLPFVQMLENIVVPGEIGPAEQLQGITNTPFRNLGRSLGLPQMTRDEFARRIREQWGPLPAHAQREQQMLIDQFDPNDSDTIWGAIDPNWAIDYGQEPAPPAAPAPEQPAAPPAAAPPPRREYTYPTETLPQAAPPPRPSFTGGGGGSPWRGGTPWITPLSPLQPMPESNRDRGYAEGGETDRDKGDYIRWEGEKSPAEYYHYARKEVGDEQARADTGEVFNATRGHHRYNMDDEAGYEGYAEGGGTIAGQTIPVDTSGPAVAAAPEIAPLSGALAARLEPLYQQHPEWRGHPEYFNDLNPNAPEFYYTLLNRTMGNSLAQKDSPWMGVLNSDTFIPQTPQPYHMVPFPPPSPDKGPPPAPDEPVLPEPEPEEPIVRQEYTYPTETLPQAAPPPRPGFLPQLTPLRPMAQSKDEEDQYQHAYGGRLPYGVLRRRFGGRNF